MSFLPSVAINMPASSSDLLNSSSSSDDSTTDSSDAIDTTSDGENEPDEEPISKKSRRIYERKPIEKSAWWYLFLSPLAKEEMENDPHSKVAEQFKRAFRMSYLLYNEHILEFAIRMWWPDWHEYQVDAFGRIVGNLELKLMGCLNVLGKGADHFSVSLQTLLSEEIRRTLFIKWIGLMASVKEQFIYMPLDELQLKFVADKYKAMGLPGCIGSVDWVHIGWDQCPVQHTNMYKGKEGYPSIAYEVICTLRKFIQSVSAGHPGARNDKHIVRTDKSVMQLLNGHAWLNSLSWESNDQNGNVQVTKGHYLICDGGYHRWPCVMFPVKSGAVGSPLSKWSSMMESIRKDVECAFGSLKQRFYYLKKFNRMKRQVDIDNAFHTCCILHNIILEDDGWLDEDLPNFPNGVKERLGKVFCEDPRGEAITDRGDDTTVDELMDAEEARRCPDETKRLKKEWERVLQRLVDHWEFHAIKNKKNN